MNTAEIECILRRAIEPLHVTFAGVFAADAIDNVVDFPTCFVVNTDPASKPGEHWVACYAKSLSEVEFFDSYGMPVSAYPNIRMPYSITRHNKISLQGYNSNACGHFCIYYLVKRAQGTTLRRIGTHLSAINAVQRETLVRRFVFATTSRLHIRRPCRAACVGLQCCGKRVLE